MGREGIDHLLVVSQAEKMPGWGPGQMRLSTRVSNQLKGNVLVSNQGSTMPYSGRKANWRKTR